LSVVNTKDIDSIFHSHRERRFKNPKISGSRRIEVKDWRNRSLRKSKNWSQKLKKSKILGRQRLKKSKIWSFETQPESATRIESRGLLTRECPSGTRRLVYRVRPMMEMDQNKDSTSWLGVEEGRL
jgi:hypothetical protein